jgi:hypothetical protein
MLSRQGLGMKWPWPTLTFAEQTEDGKSGKLTVYADIRAGYLLNTNLRALPYSNYLNKDR